MIGFGISYRGVCCHKEQRTKESARATANFVIGHLVIIGQNRAVEPIRFEYFVSFDYSGYRDKRHPIIVC